MVNNTDKANWVELPIARSPYTDWFDSKEREVFYRTEVGPPSQDNNAFTKRLFNANSFFKGRGREILRSLSFTSSTTKSADNFGFDTDTIPFLTDTVDPETDKVTVNTDPLDGEILKALAGRLDPSAVFTGVVDVGISPFHERLKATTDTTRVITCWQQAGAWTANGPPFGSEITAIDIDAAFEDAANKDVALDEETALRTHYISRPDVMFGSREVDFRAAHGSHIADLAAGGVPCPTATGKIKNPIFAVNMPPRYSHGSAGNFLEFFAFAAVVRIVDLAEQLWQEVHRGTSDGQFVPGGFPLVINLSFGMQAGAKDGSGLFERLVRELVSNRDAPTDIVMPAGNDNLNRGTARALVGETKDKAKYGDLKPKKTFTLKWRVPPSDRSSNFVELWFPAIEPKPRTDIEFCLIPPGVTATDDMWHKVIGWNRDENKPLNQYTEPDLLRGAIRLYRIFRQQSATQEIRPQIIIGVMPTEFFGSMADEPPVLAPAGLWTIKIRAKGDAINVSAHIQSDQDIRPGRGRQAIRSYFDLESYDTHTNPEGSHPNVPTGMPQDSVYLARAFGDHYVHLDDWENQGPVQRKGTNNAIATTPSIHVIGAYRVSDRTASAYSATVENERFQEGESRGRTTPVIAVLLPGDDSPMHLGMLGAGSRSGSVVALQGTSSSSALATRAIVEWRLGKDGGRRDECAGCFLNSNVEDQGYKNKAPLKIGNGLIYTETEHARHTARLTGIESNPYL